MSKTISADDLREILTEYQQSVQTVLGGMDVEMTILVRRIDTLEKKLVSTQIDLAKVMAELDKVRKQT